MNDRILFKACLTISLLGIISLFVLSELITLPTREISQITKKDLDKQVKVIGKVTNTKDLPGIFLFTLEDKKSQIKIILFKEGKINIQKNSILEIQGKVTEYKGELEIEAEKITTR